MKILNNKQTNAFHSPISLFLSVSLVFGQQSLCTLLNPIISSSFALSVHCKLLISLSTSANESFLTSHFISKRRERLHTDWRWSDDTISTLQVCIATLHKSFLNPTHFVRCVYNRLISFCLFDKRKSYSFVFWATHVCKYLSILVSILLLVKRRRSF